MLFVWITKKAFKRFTDDVIMLSGLLVSGFVVFAPKFVESQFGITAAWAAQLIGMLLPSLSSLVASLLLCALLNTGLYDARPGVAS